MRTERLFITDIETTTRHRVAVPAKVEAIKASISEIGLRTPITVSAAREGDDWRFTLVAGAHRMEALRQLGEDMIDAVIMEGSPEDAELWEIDENFARAERTDAQRADHHARREDILKRKGLVAKGPGQPKKNLDKLSRYSAKAAADLGVDERTVRRDLRRGKNISPDILADVTGTDMDKGVVLDELARAPREDQRAILAEIKERETSAKLTRYADKQVARSCAEEAAEIIHANLDLDQVDALAARLSSVAMKDFLAALSMARAA